ncbi:MAG: hypothetical protein JW774_03980 [Candidatus Aureabacteria bacterium]|nr:hypothetical protein [Candidatus Auribacterota bacterium]
MNNKDQSPSQSMIADRRIRKTFHENEWWFAVEDVVNGFMESGDFSGKFPESKGQ